MGGDGIEDGVSTLGEDGADGERPSLPFALPCEETEAMFAARSHPDEEAWAESFSVCDQSVPNRDLCLFKVGGAGGTFCMEEGGPSMDHDEVGTVFGVVLSDRMESSSMSRIE